MYNSSITFTTPHMASLLKKLKNYINRKQEEAIEFQKQHGTLGYSIPTAAILKEKENKEGEEEEYKLKIPTDYGLKDITYVDDTSKGFNIFEQQEFVRDLAHRAAQMKAMQELTAKNPNISDEELDHLLGKPISLNYLLQRAAEKGISGFHFYGAGVDPLKVENLSREIDDRGRLSNLKYRLSQPTE